jgi:L-lactate dehydrogenase
LCALIGERLDVDPRDVGAYVVGEHGDSQVPVWSEAHVGGVPLGEVDRGGGPLTPEDMADIAGRTREAGPAVAERKGATYYAVAAGLVRIARAVLRDERSVLSVSTVIDDYPGLDGRNVALSLPTVLGRGGVESVLRLSLDDGEREALKRSAGVLEEAVSQLEIA